MDKEPDCFVLTFFVLLVSPQRSFHDPCLGRIAETQLWGPQGAYGQEFLHGWEDLEEVMEGSN